jgi:hypothetical protein
MNYEDVKVGMLVYLANGYDGKFKGCVGRVIAKRKTIYLGRNILVDFSLHGDEPPFEGHDDYVPFYNRDNYDTLPEALERPKYASRWWVHHDYITKAYDNIVLDGGLL